MKKILTITFLFTCCIMVNSQQTKTTRPKLPLEDFAEFNLYEDEFAKSHNNKESSLYNFDEAKQMCPSGWHLPT